MSDQTILTAEQVAEICRGLSADVDPLFSSHEALRAEVAKLTAEQAECPTCDGSGMMDVLVRVHPPDEREEFGKETCAECGGCGVSHVGRLEADAARLRARLAQAEQELVTCEANSLVLRRDAALGRQTRDQRESIITAITMLEAHGMGTVGLAALLAAIDADKEQPAASCKCGENRHPNIMHTPDGCYTVAAAPTAGPFTRKEVEWMAGYVQGAKATSETLYGRELGRVVKMLDAYAATLPKEK